MENRRQVVEAYRQPWGPEMTAEYGRPMGWPILAGAVEKLFFPAILLVMALAGWWEALLVTVVAEVVLSTTFLAATAAHGERLWMLVKGIATTPIRYVVIFADLVTMARFALDIWFRGNREWRK